MVSLRIFSSNHATHLLSYKHLALCVPCFETSECKRNRVVVCLCIILILSVSS